ncbi:MAG: NAD(P)/FAD-dependent oxidoreductase [Pelomonas sp.]|nr:NAD(P)/FAD-dependent oxidoreductase [Roseateles sp.]
MTSRRRALLAAAALTGLAPTRAFSIASGARPRVVVVGGGWGGASAARALARAGGLEVVLVEPARQFDSTPLSNLVVAGLCAPAALVRSYARLAREVELVHEAAVAIDAERAELRLASGRRLGYDRLVLSPGVDFDWDAVDGARAAHASGAVLHAWRGGAEAARLREQIDALRPGGVFAIAIPEAPLRCPPAPYERACLVAERLQRRNPRAKLIVFDANPEPASEAAQFLEVFRTRYAGMVDYRAAHRVVGVGADGAAQRLRFEVDDDQRVDLVNLLPPMRAGTLALHAGLANRDGRWVGVRWRDFAATAAERIHVIGDAIQNENAMAKSGAMALAQGEVAGAAIAAELLGHGAGAPGELASACYSFTAHDAALTLQTRHRYVDAAQGWQPDMAARVVSAAPEAARAREAWGWAARSWAALLG